MQEEEQKLEFEKRLLEQKLQQEKEAAEEKRKLDFEYQQKLKEVQQTSSNQPTLKVPTVVKMPKGLWMDYHSPVKVMLKQEIF